MNLKEQFIIDKMSKFEPLSKDEQEEILSLCLQKFFNAKNPVVLIEMGTIIHLLTGGKLVCEIFKGKKGDA